jgi:hypothetical protein
MLAVRVICEDLEQISTTAFLIEAGISNRIYMFSEQCTLVFVDGMAHVRI